MTTHQLTAGIALAAALSTAQASPAAACCPIVELRQYTMNPGQRETLVSLYEDKFIEGQEEAGVRVVGQFRDLGNAERFVWVRGFADMEQRKAALEAFYYGPVWQANRNAANATLADNDNVLLLRPALPSSGFALEPALRPGRGQVRPAKLVVATIYYFEPEPRGDFIKRFANEVAPVLEQGGARIIGSFVSEKSLNTFPRLPVREDVHVFVWFASFADRDGYTAYLRALGDDPRWRDVLAPYITRSVSREPETLLLEPTARSLVR